jgi:ABC-2 type transport system ATP-binding protein
MLTIEVRNLVRRFKNTEAVSDISFSVTEGECFGLLGPNGAGKTTTINVLSTLLKPTSGWAKVAGFDVTKHKNDVRKNIGIVFQEPALDSRLTGRENLEFHSMMYGIDSAARDKRISNLLELVELTEKANTLVRNYSGGMKRRLEIARGLIQKPKVLFLDEPTLGLDSQTRRLIWDYIKRLNKENDVTIILTTHYMDEADFLCDRIAIIDHGKIIAMDTPAKLKESLGGDVISLEVENDIEGLKALLEGLSWVKSIKGYDDCNRCLSVSVKKANLRVPEIIALANKEGVKISSVNVHNPSLDDVFLRFTGSTIRNIEEREKEW